MSSSSFNFAETVKTFLNNEYYPQVVEAVTEVVPKVAKEAAKKLKSTSPGKNYPKGWAVKTEKGRIKVGSTVYGKSGTYQLAHLLEKGHLLRNGQRSTPIVHIKPVEEWAINEAYERIMDKLEGV